MSTIREIAKARRRNGSEASCEPCRISKLKCDHAEPTCGRCRKRGLHAKCVYHPAPLTRPTEAKTRERPRPIRQRRTAAIEAMTEHQIAPSDPRSDVLTRSNAAQLREMPPVSALADRQRTVSSMAPICMLSSTQQEQSSMVFEVVDALQHFELIRRYISVYYPPSMSANVPWQFLKSPISSLTSLVGDLALREDQKIRAGNFDNLVSRLLTNTRQAIHVDDATTFDSFVQAHSGTNVRLDLLGVLFAKTGSVYLTNVCESNVQDVLTQTMTRCCEICYRLTRQLCPNGEMLLWLSLERVILLSNMYGDLSEEVWQSLGDLTTDVFAAGWNREAIVTRETPLFLSEFRKRIASRAYYFETCIASILGRPPRVSWRWFDLTPPLDLSDDELLGPPEDLAAAISKLSPSGWSEGTQYFAASFSRLLLGIGKVREQAAEVWSKTLSQDSIAELNNISQLNRMTWDAVPARMRCTSSCWYTGLPPSVCRMLLNMYITYAGTELRLCQAMKKAAPGITKPLHKIAFEIATFISELGVARKKNISYDFSFQWLCHGLPTVEVLLDALHIATRSPSAAQVLPEGMTKASIIRLLSVLANQLRTACESTQVNYAACVQASDIIGRSLDEILENSFNHTSNPGLSSAVTGDGQLGAFEREDAGPMLSSGATIADLLKDIDWANVSCEWDLL